MYVYTDGACSNNGKPGAKAGMGIFFGVDDPRNVSRKVEGKQSNNTAELGAIIEVYSILKDEIDAGHPVTIVSDSVYAIRCVGEYGEKCSKDGWTKDIPNKEMVRRGYEIYCNKPNVAFMHVMAHTGKTDIHSVNNDHVDRLANMAIGLTSCPYEKKSKIYLDVPFAEKEVVKQHGGCWDPKKKKWYVYEMKDEIKVYTR